VVRILEFPEVRFSFATREFCRFGSGNCSSGWLNKFGAEDYLTGCVNANSTFHTKLDISPRDVKENQSLQMKNEIR